MSGFQVMPPLSDADFEALKADISERGLMVPIEVDEDGNILDGHHRARICEELGHPLRRIVRRGMTEAEKRTHARRLNIARRHLNQEQKRALIADELRDDPERSNRQIGEVLGVDDKTVGSVRSELEATAEIPQLTKTTGKDGKKRPAKPAPPPPAFEFKFDGGDEAAADAVTKGAKEVRKAKSEKVREKNRALAETKMAPPAARYGTIVIDPPWPMEKIERDIRPKQIAFDYPTMDEAELTAFGEVVNASAHEHCHLFMWTTQRFLPMGLRLLDAWRFRYVLTMVWHKPGGPQPLGLPQYNCEFCLYARRGAPEFRDTKAFPTCFEAPRRGHSAKPEEFYDLIRRVTHDGRIDVFNRRPIAGFDGWGNESAALAG